MKGSYKLNQSQFDYIVNRCDAVLTEYSHGVSIAGIAWLHVLNSHPANQAKYIHVFYKRSIGQLVTGFASRLFAICTDIFLSAFANNGNRRMPSPIDILFISHLVNADAKPEDPDFYFRELPAYLRSVHYTTAVALMQHTKELKSWSRPVTGEGVVKCMIPRRLGLGNELALTGKAVRTWFLFMQKSFRAKDKTGKKFFSELAWNAFSIDTLRASRMYEVVRSMITETKCKTVVLTWEGHSWERLVCLAANTSANRVFTVGYQHTILFPSSHALKRSISAEYDPDLILTPGTITKDILVSSLPGMNIQEYGSPRITTRLQHDPSRTLQQACLVAPEGLMEENIRMFSFAVATARMVPQVSFVFRTHPTIKFKEVQEKDDRLLHLPENIVISSHADINKDIDRCGWVLYRSSSVSFVAALSGLRPICLQVKDELPNDPMYALSGWRLYVQEPGELAGIITSDMQKTASEIEMERQPAIAFSQAYMKPYDVRVFEQFITAGN